MIKPQGKGMEMIEQKHIIDINEQIEMKQQKHIETDEQIDK